MVVSCHVVTGDLNLGPPEEQPVQLTASAPPFLQFLITSSRELSISKRKGEEAVPFLRNLGDIVHTFIQLEFGLLSSVTLNM